MPKSPIGAFDRTGRAAFDAAGDWRLAQRQATEQFGRQDVEA